MTGSKPLVRISDIEDAVTRFAESAETSPELAREFLWWLSGAAHDSARRLRRTVTAVFAVALVFELSNRQILSEASLAGVKFAKLDFVLPLLPILVALLFLRACSLTVERRLIEEALTEYSRQRFSELANPYMLNLLAPDASPLFKRIPTPSLRRWPRLLLFWLGRAEAAVITLFPVIFSIYAYIELFNQEVIGKFALCICACVTMGILATSLIVALSDTRACMPIGLAHKQRSTRQP